MPETDTKINYYLRQQKSIERRMFCQLFSSINRAFNIHQYRYIGMGAKYFADFLLFHREFGFKNMISIEADEAHRAKYEFNKPLSCIHMEYGFSYEVLPRLDWTEMTRSIIWLDYDSKLEKYMLENIETVISKIPSGSMFFISYNSEWPKHGMDLIERRRTELTNKLGDYFPNTLTNRDYADVNKHRTLRMPINNTIDNAISLRRDMAYAQLVDFIYQDGCEMTTIGGIILNRGDLETFSDLDFTHLDYVKQDRCSDAYSLVIPPITHKEAVKIFEYLPCEDLSKISIPGLNEGHIKQIAKVYRYYPFYLETSLFT